MRPWLALLALLLVTAGGIGHGQEMPRAVDSGDEAALLAAADRGSVRALLQLAELRSRRGDAAGAAEPLRRALAIAPNSERVLVAYAKVSLAARAPAPALVALEPLARMYPTVGDYSYLLGVAWLQLGDAAMALPALEQARELQPRRALTLAAMGIALNQQKRFAEAKEVLDQAIRLAPDDAEVLAVLAEAEEGLGERAAAVHHARAALARSPGHTTALLVVALVHMQEERYGEAREALEAALATDSGSAKAHYQLSLACARLGDRDCAARHVELYRQAQRALEERVNELRSQSLDSAEARP